MPEFKPLDAKLSATAQVSEEDVKTAAQEGYTVLISNRPDGEEDGQPAADTVRKWARENGLDFRHIPVSGSDITMEKISGYHDAFEGADGKALAFCKTGKRSAALWALSRAREGADADTLIKTASGAGYDLSNIRPFLEQLSGHQA